jgi:hypothetical protein
VHPEAAFLAGYALVLTLVSLGLESLGRRSTDPWASPTLAASKPRAEHRRCDRPEWPDSEVATFHIGLSAVAVELVTHAGLLFVIAVRVRHLLHRHRTVAGGG